MNWKHIRQARKARHMTQDQLARAIGTGQSYISALENGSQPNVTLDLLQRIAAAMGMVVRVELTDPTEDATSPEEAA
jgi:transcriptional regulator with XRE-family HTH domain